MLARIRLIGGTTLKLAILVTITTSKTFGDAPQNPLPFLIALQPPFPGRYWGIGETEDGNLIVGGDGVIGVYDGLRWREIPIPGNTARDFLQRGQRIWAAVGGSIGWFSAAPGDDQFHRVVTDIHGEALLLFKAGSKFAALTYDAVLLIDNDGKVVKTVSLGPPLLRHKVPRQNGWLLVSPRDAYYLKTNGKFEVTDNLPISRTILTQDRLCGAIPIGDTVFLPCTKTAYEWKHGVITETKLKDWTDLWSEHVITVLQMQSDSTLVRVSGDGGIEGFDLTSKKKLWQLKVGEEIVGNLGEYPRDTKRGLFFGSETKLYWIPSPSAVRKLTGFRQEGIGVDSGTSGFWVSTSGGSWNVNELKWTSSLERRDGATFTVNEGDSIIRGQINSITLNDKRIFLKSGMGQISDVVRTTDRIILRHGNAIEVLTSTGEPVTSITISDICTSLAFDGTNGIIVGTSRSGILHWDLNHPPQEVKHRGEIAAYVAGYKNITAVLWKDGRLELGARTMQLPSGPEIYWDRMAITPRHIVASGSFQHRTALYAIEIQADRLSGRPLEDRLWEDVGTINRMAIRGNTLAIAGSNGCTQISLSYFSNTYLPYRPIIAMSQREEESFLSNDNATIRLPAGRDTIRYFINSNRIYWKQRVKFAYRLLPDSTEWTDLDPAQEVDIQRIAAGKHTLEIESQSLAGTATTRYTIIRPPHWYASRWAFGAYGLSLMGATAGFFVWRTRRLRERARVLEERVAQRTTELKKANEAKDEFLASMSHEIRNPLNGVIGLSSMLQESVQTERDRRLTESLRACADQLRLVLDDVLDFSVIERGEVQVQLAPFNPAAAIHAAVVSVDAKLERTRVTFGPKLSDGLWLRGDAGKLRQIVSNLVSNAHKYGVPPEAKVDARLHEGCLVVTVSNSGPDIPPDDQPRIFGSFERGRSAAHKHVRGAGLGLTISARFARAMGGDITVKSETGLTSFTVSLPMPLVEAPANGGSDSAPGNRGTALAIEDEPYNRLVLGHILGGLGFEVEWAQTGAEALDIVRSGRAYALIFTDWMLPDMEGGELVREIKAVRGETTPPIIAVTAYATAEKRAEAFAAGVAAFVTKPVTPEKIAGALQASGQRDEPPNDPEDKNEPLRVGILLDSMNAAERVLEFRRQLAQQMTDLASAVQRRESEFAAQTAHRLASQLLAIHHHTFADELRALETAALREQWDLANELCANAARAATSLSRQLEAIARSQAAKTNPRPPAP